MYTTQTKPAINPIAELIQQQRVFFKTNATKSIDFRVTQLKALKGSIIQYEAQLLEALYQDLGKSDAEAFLTEIAMVKQEIDNALRYLKKWAAPQRATTPLQYQPAKSYKIAEPYGVVLVVAPWNYPVQLALLPVVGAIVAGNTVVLKPSEVAPASSKVLKEMLTNNFEENFVAVVEGGIEEAKTLMNERFDYIFFTGSTQVGQIYYEAAAKHLTPVTLELGGKSPCIVEADANLKKAAERIIFGKYLNCGQTCIAPDYLLVNREVKEELIAELKAAVEKMYTKNTATCEWYPRIINEHHFNRLVGMIESEKVIYGGKFDQTKLYIAPTFMDNITKEDAAMQEEIFGPILPIMTVDNVTEAIDFINEGEKPLALYIFSKNQQTINQVFEATSFGNGCVNDTIIQISNKNLPFGGVGKSGIGSYHGRYSFETFSHYKSIMKQAAFEPTARFRFAPWNYKLLRQIFKYL
jgi:aldehyde dehydrogenase (NAD+)